MPPESESRLKKVGLAALVPLGIIGFLILTALLLRGMVWVSEKALPWLTTGSEIAHWNLRIHIVATLSF
jgi:hypothetical protein